MATTTINPVRDAMKLSLIQQAVAFVFSGLVIDGGGLFLIVAFALAAFWIGALMILSRRGQQISRLDTFLLKWGFFPLCIISFFLARWIWTLRGYHAS
jgi:hypothetical protein